MAGSPPSLALERQTQEDHKFQANLDCKVKPVSKQTEQYFPLNTTQNPLEGPEHDGHETLVRM